MIALVHLPARELVLVQKITDLHLDEVQKLFIIDSIALVHENDDVRNTDLTGKQDVLAGLGHDAVGSGNDKDRAVHLCSTGDHVLDVVSMARAVNMRIVSLLGGVLDVRRVDRDTALLLFRSLIDHIEVSLHVTRDALCENSRDRCGQRGFAVVNVADRADIAMRL